MREPPDIRELIGDDVPDEQMEELRRVDRLLRSVPAPPHQVPPRLTQAVTSLTLPTPFWSRRRMALAVALAAALAAGFFGIGRLTSDPGVQARATVPLHATEAAPEAAAVVQVGERDEKSGNWELILEVTGLPKLPGERYYTLWLEKDGEYAGTCGTFAVGAGDAEAEWTVSYDFTDYDAWVVSARVPGDEPADAPRILEAEISF